MNITDVIIIAIISLLVIYSIRSLYKNRGSCGGSCAGCSSANRCNSMKSFYED